jgi:hypothetical protein
MPGTKDFAQAVIFKKYPGLTSMVMCFEDACPEDEVPAAEQNSIHVLNALKEAEDSGKLKYEDIPLLFFRVRSLEQFQHFSTMLRKDHIRYITGFNFPKFNSVNGGAYMNHLVELNNKFGEIIYGMPIIGYRLPDGSYLENTQLEPDIKVANDPATVVKGEDSQLKAAVEELLREIK